MIVDHQSVLLTQAVDLLQVVPGGKYVDATYGRGGHTKEIERRGGKVLTIDADSSMQPMIIGNFNQLEALCHDFGWQTANGVLFDLGISMTQLMDKTRGFAMDIDGKLDMRMAQQDDSLASAGDIINLWPEEMLTKIFFEYAQVKQAQKLARAIIARRPLATTYELVHIINDKAEARKVFQALRIAVNDELENLKTGLIQGLAILANKGRIVVIAFHSLEDRIVKQQFTTWQTKGLGQVITPKAILGERKSKMRCFEKI